MITNPEIKQRLKRYKKWRRDRLREEYIGPPALWADFDWLIDELGRQLEKNEVLCKKLPPPPRYPHLPEEIEHCQRIDAELERLLKDD